MNVAVLSLVLIAGTGADNNSATSGVVTKVSHSANVAGASDCACEGQGHGKNKTAGHFCGLGDMPQSCYNPSYGCYPGNERFVNRYPAFHGTYYRACYNYRNAFDYPWHAELHEPVSLFAYNVIAPAAEERAAPAGPTRPSTSSVKGIGTLPKR